MKLQASFLMISGTILIVAGPLLSFVSPGVPAAFIAGSGLVVTLIGAVLLGSTNREQMTDRLKQTIQIVSSKKCPVCGAADFDLGFLTGHYGVFFVSSLRKGIIPKRQGLRAVACKQCGHVMVFLEKDEP